MNEIDNEVKEVLFKGLIIAGSLGIFVAFVITGFEFYNAVSFCNSLDGKYGFAQQEFEINATTLHFCNEKPIARYGKSWDFVENHPDLSNIKINLP